MIAACAAWMSGFCADNLNPPAIRQSTTHHVVRIASPYQQICRRALSVARGLATIPLSRPILPVPPILPNRVGAAEPVV